MFQNTTNKIIHLVRTLSRRNILILAIFCILVAVILVNVLKKEDALNAEKSQVRAVEVSPVSLLSGDTSSVSLLGTVTSKSEATIRGESSGRITLYKRLGDFVPAGGVIGEFDNSGERAAVLVAEGAYDAALAQKSIASIGRGTSQTSLEEAKTSVQNTLENVRTTIVDVVRTKTDALFSNPGQRGARFLIQSADSRLVMSVEEERFTIDRILSKETDVRALSEKEPLIAALNASEADLRIVAKYLDDILSVLGDGIPDTKTSQSVIDGYRGAVTGARQSVSGALTQVAGARSALSGASAAASIAEETSGVAQRTSVTDAAVKSALGNLQAARARLDKTVVRSPISGTINSLPVTSGDYISPFTVVAVVSNNGALEILAYASDDDARLLTVGAKVNIEGAAVGIITRIAPAIDPQTKKVEIRVGITEGAGMLVNGQSVRIDVVRSTVVTKKSGPLTIPLSALKITPEGSVVFTVTASSTVLAHPVKTGTLLGSKIVITEGVTPDMAIVVDARGLKDGMTVTVIQ